LGVARADVARHGVRRAEQLALAVPAVRVRAPGHDHAPEPLDRPEVALLARAVVDLEVAGELRDVLVRVLPVERVRPGGASVDERTCGSPPVIAAMSASASFMPPYSPAM